MKTKKSIFSSVSSDGLRKVYESLPFVLERKAEIVQPFEHYYFDGACDIWLNETIGILKKIQMKSFLFGYPTELDIVKRLSIKAHSWVFKIHTKI